MKFEKFNNNLLSEFSMIQRWHFRFYNFSVVQQLGSNLYETTMIRRREKQETIKKDDPSMTEDETMKPRLSVLFCDDNTVKNCTQFVITRNSRLCSLKTHSNFSCICPVKTAKITKLAGLKISLSFLAVCITSKILSPDQLTQFFKNEKIDNLQIFTFSK